VRPKGQAHPSVTISTLIATVARPLSRRISRTTAPRLTGAASMWTQRAPVQKQIKLVD